MQVRDLMDPLFPWTSPDINIEQAIDLFRLTRASDLMVLKEKRLLYGVLSEGDLIRAILPDLSEIKQIKGNLRDAQGLAMKEALMKRKQSILPYIIKTPIVITPDTPILMAAVMMEEMFIRCLPVIEYDQIIGTLSKSDIALSLNFIGIK